MPVPPPVITATKPFTPNKEAASREDILENDSSIDKDGFVGSWVSWGSWGFIYSKLMEGGMITQHTGMVIGQP
jgi:hypothetical protein